MKVIKILLVVTLSFILLGGCVSAKSVFPTSGKIVGSIEEQNLDRDIQVKEFGDNSIVIAIPIFTDLDDSWKVHASIGWTDGVSWKVIPMDSYLRETAIKDNYAVSTITFPKKGNGWFWVRIWGWNDNLQKWLIINDKSKYLRADAEGKPGYEMLVNIFQKKEQPVSGGYDIRK